MGARGPLPKPEVRRRNERPVTARIAMTRPKRPAGLSAEARAEWARVVAMLEEIGSLHAVDQSLLLRYCSAWAEWVELNAQIAKAGRWVRGRSGEIVRSPLVLLRRDLGRELTELAVQLGMTPAARLRNGVRHEREKPVEDEDRVTSIDEYRRYLGVTDGSTSTG